MVDFLKNFWKKLDAFGITLLFALLFFIAMGAYAGPSDDNHVHVEQVGNGGDDVSLTIAQLGYGNKVEFSFAHSDNIFNLTQNGSGNYVGWVSYWGSGKNWGGDVDGTDNNEVVVQFDGATYGRHLWGNNNDVDVYQNGDHTFNLDVHADDTNVEAWQEGSGSHYAHSYFYGTADGSDVDLEQKGNANHNAQIRLQGTEPTTLNLLQQGTTNQSYSVTQNCFTVGGCSLTVTQGN